MARWGVRMANVQKENGFVSIAHELLSALFRSHVPRTHVAVMLAVMDKTYGWTKKADRISAAWISKFTDLDQRNVRRTLNDLERWNMIKRSPPNGKSLRIISVQKDYDQWSYAAPKTRSHRSPTPGSTSHQAVPHAPPDRSPAPSLDRSPTPPIEEEEEGFKNVDAHAPTRTRRSNRKAKPPQDADRLARLLGELVVERYGHGSPKTYRPWTEEIAQLHDAGRGPDWSEIEETIRWLYGPANQGDYRVVVQSGKALRKKYLTAREGMTRRMRRVESFKRSTGTLRVPDFKPRDGPRLSESPEDAEKLAQEFAELREQDAPKVRRAPA